VENYTHAIRGGFRLTGELLAAVALAVAAVRIGGILGTVAVVMVIVRFHGALAAERRLATIDAATGALNRRAFTAVAERERRRAERSGRPLSLAYLDLDGLKDVNDRLGHRAGDRALRAAAAALASSLRAGDLIGRVGGDEFALLLPDTDVLGAARASERVRHTVAAACRERDVPVTVSVGTATFRFPPTSVDDMLSAADRLMYRSKEAGGNRVTGSAVPFHVIRWGGGGLRLVPNRARDPREVLK
jgi:diguanylate cyclase (GGDEF)-like protein